jgi:hypothetical protein
MRRQGARHLRGGRSYLRAQSVSGLPEFLAAGQRAVAVPGLVLERVLVLDS